jgi:hypothetical protein
MGIRILRWVLAAVLAAQGLAFAASPPSGARAAVPAVLRVAVGGIEAAGAVLLLFRSTLVGGAVALAASLVAAGGLHAWLGVLPPLGYLVDLAAIFAVVDSMRRGRRSEGPRG